MINESTIYLWATETFVSDGDDLTIRQLVRLLESRRRGSGLHLLLKVQGDVGQLLLDVTNDFALGGGGERVTTLSQDLCKRQNSFLKIISNDANDDNDTHSSCSQSNRDRPNPNAGWRVARHNLSSKECKSIVAR